MRSKSLMKSEDLKSSSSCVFFIAIDATMSAAAVQRDSRVINIVNRRVFVFDIPDFCLDEAEICSIEKRSTIAQFVCVDLGGFYRVRSSLFHALVIAYCHRRSQIFSDFMRA